MYNVIQNNQKIQHIGLDLSKGITVVRRDLSIKTILGFQFQSLKDFFIINLLILFITLFYKTVFIITFQIFECAFQTHVDPWHQAQWKVLCQCWHLVHNGTNSTDHSGPE